MPGLLTRQFGFTLVELVTVIVVMGVLAAMVAPRFMERIGFDAVSLTHQTAAMIRYGQKVAIAQNRTVFVRLNGNSIALCYTADCGTIVAPASGENSGSSVTLSRCGNSKVWACEGVPTGLTMSSASTFFFDATGKPFAGTDNPLGLTSTFQTLSIAISGDGLPHSVVVVAETGYVY